MLRSAIILTALGLPSWALGECPNSADLDLGITVTYSNGEIETFRNAGNGIIVLNGIEQNEDGQVEWVSSSYGGLFELGLTKRELGLWHPVTDYDFEYNFNFDDSFPLEAGNVGGGTQTLIGDTYTEDATYSYSVNNAEDITIGDCSYAAFDIFVTYVLPETKFGVIQIKYLQDLGFGYAAAGKWPDQDGFEAEAIAIVARR